MPDTEKSSVAVSSEATYLRDQLKLIEQNKVLRQGIQAVRELIEASEGVSGLHLNEDIATWEDLLVGGYLEDWLVDFSEAEEIVNDK